MQLNLTVFIQIFNITITYFFLRKFMFQPVIDFLRARDEKNKEIKNRLRQKEEDLLSLEKLKQEELKHFKVKAKTAYVIPPVKKVIIPEKVPCMVNTEEIKKLTEFYKNVLVKRVPHVD